MHRGVMQVAATLSIGHMQGATALLELDQCHAALRERYRQECLGHGDDVHGTHFTSPEEEPILQHPRVGKVIQQLNGGLDSLPFHGFRSLESAAKILVEHAVPLREANLCRLLDHIERLSGSDPQLYAGIGKVGRILDDCRLGGSSIIRASILAHASREEAEGVGEAVREAIEVFSSMARVESMDELTEPYRGKLVYRQGVVFPSYYHLRLLAFTQGWRTGKNMESVICGCERLLALRPSQPVYCRFGSQLVAPASLDVFRWFRPFGECDDGGKMFWLDRMEMMARSGLVSRIPALSKLVDELAAEPDRLIDMLAGIRNSRYFHLWGAYTGLAIEPDWRARTRKIADLLFRILVICKYSGRLPTEE